MEQFSTILVDPPWPFKDRGSRITPGYQFMDEAAILALPVELLAAPQAHLYLWTTDSHLSLALECCTAWGFLYKQTLVWVKQGTPDRLQIGMGHWYRHAHELCLFAVRGKLKATRHDLPSVLFERRAGHSKKPERLWQLAEKMSPGPRLELFACRRRWGWLCLGDELQPGFDLRIPASAQRILDKRRGWMEKKEAW